MSVGRQHKHIQLILLYFSPHILCRHRPITRVATATVQYVSFVLCTVPILLVKQPPKNCTFTAIIYQSSRSTSCSFSGSSGRTHKHRERASRAGRCLQSASRRFPSLAPFVDLVVNACAIVCRCRVELEASTLNAHFWFRLQNRPWNWDGSQALMNL